MYCGDETGAIVGEIGSSTCKFGFAGEDLPKAVLDTVVGRSTGDDARYFVGTNSVCHRATDMDIVQPFKRGVVQDWDMVERIWEHAVTHVLSSDFRDHPVLACTPTVDTVDARSKYVEMILDKFGSKAVFLGRGAMLSSFAVGKPTTLVVDVGGSGAVSAPVVEGFVLQSGVKQSDVGGDLVDQEVQRVMEEKTGAPIRTPCSFERIKASYSNDYEYRTLDDGTLKMIRDSYSGWQRAVIARDVKESMCGVALSANTKTSEEMNSSGGEDSVAEEEYELPDGTKVVFANERTSVYEVLFRGRVKKKSGDQPPQAKEARRLGLHELVYESVKASDADIRRTLLQHILLTGGGSLAPGLADRCHKELCVGLPTSFKARFLSPIAQERQYGAWIGGSVLASLGSFQQLWISKSEFEEHGSSIIEQKCKQ